MDSIALWFHRIAEFLYYVNPVMMIFACCMWVKLYSMTSKQLGDAAMKAYVLERQMDILLRRNPDDPIREWEMKHIDNLRKMYE